MPATEVSRRTKLLILLGFVPVAGLFAWGAIRAPVDSTDARTRCLEPYFAAVDAARYDEAYARYTTDGYRAGITADAFRGALEERARERGKVVGRNELILHGFAEVGGASGFHAKVWVRYERGQSANVQYRIVHGGDGTWRIDAIGEHVAGNNAVVPRPF